MFLANFLFYIVSLAGIVACPWWPVQLLCVALCSVRLGVLAAIGHDAGHNSLTGYAWLNGLLGRLAMLPVLIPFAMWRLGHNRGHHDFTNLKGKDFVWTPLSKGEYDRLSFAGRVLQRFYRTFLGVGAYYLIELGLKSAFMRQPQATRKGLKVVVASLDGLLVAGFVVFQGWALCAAHHSLATAWGLPELSAPAVLFLGMLLPFLAYCWIGGAMAFLLHTHPRIKWYADREQWSFFGGAVQSATQVKVSWPWSFLFPVIEDHAAHHVDTRIPLHNLAKSQQQLQATYPDVIIEKFSLTSFRRHLATCQLYDYQHHRWLDFAGNPTTAPLA